ncbi:MAG: FAD-dependent oxidoreductase [Candidatus Latescibacteria bacterium]|nr:FAD-dependent oxidoreductase [Candidatus Latescibacterota bacterium]
MNRRLPPQPGEWIDRDRLLEFSFEGQSYKGLEGDLIASALLANGVRMMGRSFKYHRPRSAYSLAGHDANALFSDGALTHLRGDATPLTQGMDLHAVNTVGGLASDRLKIIDRFSHFMPVGFYYKTFHRPAKLFPYHERQIRKIAGLGTVDPSQVAPHSPKDYAWCDVLVVGGGAAGLEAALAAGQAGARVLLVEESAQLGGSLAWQQGPEGAALIDGLTAALTALPQVEIRTASQVGGHYADHWLALFDAQRMTKLRAGAVVYATGAIEQPAVFSHNDLPGIMLASAAQRLVRLYAVRPFDRVVVLGANSEAYRVALDLARVGIEVVTVADLRPQGEPSELAQQVAGSRIPVRCGYCVHQALPSTDKQRVAGVVLTPLDAHGQPDTRHGQHIPCDGIVVSVGWMPNAALPSQAGVSFAYSDELQQLVPTAQPRGVFLAGRARGVYDLEGQHADGMAAGQAAAAHTGHYHEKPVPAASPSTRAHSHPYPIFDHPEKKNFVDFDEDLHLTDFANAHQEGYDSVELLKRYSTVGMGPSQGKLSNMNAVRILARLNEASIDETGSTTARPFYQPVPLGHLAGRRFHPMRRTPLHNWHQAHGAQFYHAGDWYRPEYYRHGQDDRAAGIVQEAQQVRDSLGLIDVGTLGKLRVNGPDAAQLLERLYSGRFNKLAVGRYRYGVALDESGVIVEDGVLARLAPDQFYVTATSSGAGAFYREMQRWALIWGLDVTLSNATSHLAAFNLAGPQARRALAGLTDTDLNPEAFPYLGVRQGKVAGVPALLMRVGFVGELGFEVHVPAGQATQVWEALMDAGQPFSIRPFGVEAQRLLRLEKGHFIVGHDTDALTHPYEVSLDWAIGKNKRFFVGQRSLEIMSERPLTRTLVGLRWPDGQTDKLPEECNLIIDQGRIAGRITSIAPRSTLGYPLAMAFVEPEMAVPGTQVEIRLDNGSRSTAQVVAMPFYDPDDQRQKE